MDWRRTSEEETEELRRFVEDMKRGRTPATSDSLLETLRQIHDKREAPAPSPEHRQMLLARLRRETAARSGVPMTDTSPVLFFPREPKPRKALRWALAASLVVHVAGGAAVLTSLRFGPSVIAGVLGGPPREEAAQRGEPTWLAPTFIAPVEKRVGSKRSNERLKGGIDDPRVAGDRVGDTAGGRLWQAASDGQPTAVRVAVTPKRPAVGLAGPMVSTLAPDAGVLADEGMLHRSGVNDLSRPPGPDPSEAPSPWSEVLSDVYDHKGLGIVPHKMILYPSPVYTDKGIEDRVQGVVKVSAVLAADGTVREVRLLKSLGHGLDEAAIQAVRKARFQPATRGGVPISVTVFFNVRFTLR